MKEKIREIVMSCGADLCGFAGIDRFGDAPDGFHPRDVFQDCKTVISFAVALPKGLSQIHPRLVYGHFNGICVSEVDRVAFQAAKRIEEGYPCEAVPVPCDTPYESWDSQAMEGRGLISMKHAAVQAGLGTIGRNALFVNRHFGNWITLGAILISVELPSDAPAESLCLTQCRKCAEACPAGAICDGAVDQKRCREHTYGKTTRGFSTVDCNMCRVICPLRFGR